MHRVLNLKQHDMTVFHKRKKEKGQRNKSPVNTLIAEQESQER
jgi:hypothetical protein